MAESRLSLVPIAMVTANAVVRDWHRHNRPVICGLFAIGAQFDFRIVGVAIVGRPLARALEDGFTAEVRRTCCIPEAPKNTNSFLYAACWRAWRAMGGRRLVTYNLETESGASLRGAGWKVVAEVRAKPWTHPSRPRDYQPVYGQRKLRWEVEA